MKNSSVAVLALTASLFGYCAKGNAECNFDRPTGSCAGTIEILSSGGKKPSFSAEARVTSSAGACSKVEFYVKSTPYTSVIRTDGVENESLSSSSPIKKGDIKVAKCTAYEGSSTAQKDTEDVKSSASGRWGYFFDSETIKVETTFTLSDDNGTVSGSGTETTREQMVPRGPFKPSVKNLSISGQRNGSDLSLTINNGKETYTLNLQLKGNALVVNSRTWATRR